MVFSYQNKKIVLKMKQIPLTQGKFALVDDEDYEYLNQWKWYAVNDHKMWYAIRNVKINHRKTTIKMHRIIMNPSIKEQIDHKDRDGLNNQKHNLRICNNSQNHMNIKSRAKSGYKGVYWHVISKKWVAQIKTDKVYHLGLFITKELAALAYNKAAEELFGEFAYLNPILKKRRIQYENKNLYPNST